MFFPEQFAYQTINGLNGIILTYTFIKYVRICKRHYYMTDKAVSHPFKTTAVFPTCVDHPSSKISHSSEHSFRNQ